MAHIKSMGIIATGLAAVVLAASPLDAQSTKRDGLALGVNKINMSVGGYGVGTAGVEASLSLGKNVLVLSAYGGTSSGSYNPVIGLSDYNKIGLVGIGESFDGHVPRERDPNAVINHNESVIGVSAAFMSSMDNGFEIGPETGLRYEERAAERVALSANNQAAATAIPSKLKDSGLVGQAGVYIRKWFNVLGTKIGVGGRAGIDTAGMPYSGISVNVRFE